MNIKKILFWILFIFYITGLHAGSETDLKRVLNLNLGMRDIAMSFETGEASQFNKDQFVIVIGSVASLNPQKTSSYLITKNDLADPSAFAELFKTSGTEFTKAVVKKFSSRTTSFLEKTEINKKTINSVLKTLLRELSRVFRRQLLYFPEIVRNNNFPPKLLKLVSQTQPADEMGFLNRLIFEHFYPQHIKKYQINLSLQDGEWISYDVVRTYKMEIVFHGVECFKIFNRREANKAALEYIPLNSKAMIVGSLEKEVVREGQQIWQATGNYIRRIP